MNYLSLFSGIGGIDLGLDRAGMTCVGQVEIDPFCRAVLAKHWPHVRRLDDVRTVTAKDFKDETIDLIAGGFPCQDISTSNHSGRGIDGNKSGLWKEFYRIICEFRPDFVLVENVANLLRRGIGTVLGDLATIRYDAEWECFPAYAFGADIVRDRLFILAQPEQKRRKGILCGFPSIGFEPHPAWGSSDSLDSPNARAERIESWLCEPAILRSINGLPARLVESKLGACGNAVVPQIAEFIGRKIISTYLDIESGVAL